MQVIHTDLAPAAIGTYSQAIRVGHMVFVSGQIPLDPMTMNLSGDDIKSQLEQVFKNLSAVCAASGGSLNNIVKLTVYLTNLSHFPLVNEGMTRYFSQPFPARAVVGVAALPRGALVEMDAVMMLDESE